jgi:hypothetical protein
MSISHAAAAQQAPAKKVTVATLAALRARNE